MRFKIWLGFSGPGLLLVLFALNVSSVQAQPPVDSEKFLAPSSPPSPSSVGPVPPQVAPPTLEQLRNDPDIVIVDDVNFAVAQTRDGSSINWLTGATCNCDDDPGFDFNPYFSDGNLRFWFWGVDAQGRAGLSLDGASYAVLSPGGFIGPASTFITISIPQATLNWRQAENVDGFLGFRFTNAETGELNYGYARLTTTGTSGFPKVIVSYAYNRAGGPIIVPLDDGVFADRFEQ